MGQEGPVPPTPRGVGHRRRGASGASCWRTTAGPRTTTAMGPTTTSTSPGAGSSSCPTRQVGSWCSAPPATWGCVAVPHSPAPPRVLLYSCCVPNPALWGGRARGAVPVASGGTLSPEIRAAKGREHQQRREPLCQGFPAPHGGRHPAGCRGAHPRDEGPGDQQDDLLLEERSQADQVSSPGPVATIPHVSVCVCGVPAGAQSSSAPPVP